ncbi:SDR family NAD(P)-dependent oxidoreductase [Sphingomonas bacterium]|uniref:SDR family NAD(P)-dependent oxidoreductase n=1 Tax=Sphingomonas bacterium TaxID=1895847 RepID=UPI0015766E7A|nr:SDR family oxidoreductase [Sphingomonas bacterium]
MFLTLTPLQDRVAVVAGGSSGIGAATARLLAEAGAHVLVGYNEGADRADAIVAELPGGTGRHCTARLALGDSATLGTAAADVEARWGRCDMLVNSAGFTRAIPHGDLDALDDATFDRILIANVRGPFACIRAFAPLMRRTGEALVVNVSSISAFTGAGSNVAYCASKAALDTMGMSLGRALGPQIRVVSVSPAAVNTGFVPGRDAAALQAAADRTPMKRVMEADEVARAILATATHLTMATGTVIVVDGGRHL